MKENYQIITDKIIEEIKKEDIIPSLLLHACCAPCSSYCIEYLSEYFNITMYFYNPNIGDEKEYKKRADELERFVNEINTKNPVDVVIGEYEPQKFYEIAKGLEKVPEGGERCFRCYRQRLEATVNYAKKERFDFFTTTLSISPLKNSAVLNNIGSELCESSGINYLYSDFKKRNGYKRSIELSKEHDLYRQNYCGCIYSKRDNIST